MLSALQWICGVLGLFLVGWSILRYETEEKAVHDALAAWWIRLDDLSDTSISRNVAFARATGATVTIWLDRIFGKRLLTLNAFAASLCLSLASLFLCGVVGILFTGIDEGTGVLAAVISVPLGISMLLFYMAVTPGRRDFRIALSIGIFVLCVLLFQIARIGSGSQFESTAFPAGLLLGIASDFAVVLAVRRLASWTADSGNIWHPLLAASISALLGIGTLAVPLYYVTRVGDGHAWESVTLGLAATSNVFTAVLSLGMTILSATLVVQRLLWPLIKRPVYALHRFKLLEQRMPLFYCGTVLIGVSFPRIASILKAAAGIVK